VAVTAPRDERGEFAEGGSSSGRTRIACLSSGPWNPYLRLLYGSLARHGLEPESDGELSLRWLLRARRRIRWLHVHWPENLYRFERGPAALRPLLSRVKLGLFAMRLAAARRLGYRLVWTIHQVRPHETTDPRLDRLGAAVLARSCDVLLAHDGWTADEARRELGPSAARVEVVPHGSYIGAYPPGRPRDVVREELGLPLDAVVFLCFGELRGYKDVDVLLEAIAHARVPSSALIVAGNVKDQQIGGAVRAAAAVDSRIRLLPGFVPEDDVAELFGAADVAVLPRGDGGTSGSLILALSLGAPVVVADAPTYRELTGKGEAGWLFRAGDAASLRAALEAAAADPDVRQAKARAALDAARRLDWPASAARIAALLSR